MTDGYDDGRSGEERDEDGERGAACGGGGNCGSGVRCVRAGADAPIVRGKQKQLVVMDGTTIKERDDAITSTNIIGARASFTPLGEYGYGAA